MVTLLAQLMPKLTPKKLSALDSILQCATIAAAARHCEIPEQTLHRWIREPEFAAELKAGEQAILKEVVGSLRRHAREAVAQLHAIMMNVGNPPAVRVAAADKLLNHAVKMVDAVELKAEIEAVRAELAALKTPETKHA